MKTKNKDKVVKIEKNLEFEVEDFTPGFIFGVALAILAMIAVVILFAVLVAGGAMAISGALNG